MLYSIKAKKKIVYQRFECNLLLLDISIRTLWIRPSTGATNVTRIVFHPQSPEFVVEFVVLNLMISVLWNIISFIVFFRLSRSLYTLTSDYLFAIYRRFFNLIHITVVF
jgi:hypothetical protein